MLLFLMDPESLLKALQQQLNAFAHISGLKINQNKSIIFVSNKTEAEEAIIWKTYKYLSTLVSMFLNPESISNLQKNNPLHIIII